MPIYISRDKKTKKLQANSTKSKQGQTLQMLDLQKALKPVGNMAPIKTTSLLLSYNRYLYH